MQKRDKKMDLKNNELKKISFCLTIQETYP